MLWLVKLIDALGAMRWFKDGHSASFVWRWYHPLSWIFGPLLFVLNIFSEGFPKTWKYRHDLGFGLSPFWQARKKDILWLDSIPKR